MDPKVFHQWPNQTRVAGGRAVPGLIIKAAAAAPAVKRQPTPAGASVASPKQTETFSPVSPTATVSKPTQALPAHQGPKSFEMPSVSKPEGISVTPPSAPHTPSPPSAPPAGGGNGPTKPPKGGGSGGATKEAKLKSEMAGIQQRRQQASAGMGPDVMGMAGLGYQIGLVAGTPVGPAATASMGYHKLMGAAHGMMQPHDSDRDRQMRNAYGQRAEMLRVMRQEGTGGTQSSLARSVPLVVAGIRRIG